MRIMIAADLVPTPSNVETFERGETEELFDKELRSLWYSSDARAFNLEAPLSDEPMPILKSGPLLRASERSIVGIKQLKPTLVTLANNHIMDHGIKGLDKTRELLEKNLITHVGAGDNIQKAGEPLILDTGSERVGFYACAEHEYSLASRGSPGANPYDPQESPDHVASLKADCDFVVVLYHGGNEYFRFPAPYLQKRLRKLVDKGADFVVSQHSHCIGCFEYYKEGLIVYGQGNFLFDSDVNNEFLSSGLLIELDTKRPRKEQFIPIIKNGSGVKLAKGNARGMILEGFFGRSEEILAEGLVEEKFEELARSKINEYLNCFSRLGNFSTLLTGMVMASFFKGKRYKRRHLLKLQNTVRCEAHRELLLEGLKVLLEGYPE